MAVLTHRLAHRRERRGVRLRRRAAVPPGAGRRDAAAAGRDLHQRLQQRPVRRLRRIPTTCRSRPRHRPSRRMAAPRRQRRRRRAASATTSSASARRAVSGEYFELLGVRPAAGRLCRRPMTDSRRRRRSPSSVTRSGGATFGGDPASLGTTADAQRAAFTIVGIAPDALRRASTSGRRSRSGCRSMPPPATPGARGEPRAAVVGAPSRGVDARRGAGAARRRSRPAGARRIPRSNLGTLQAPNGAAAVHRHPRIRASSRLQADGPAIGAS